jgi:predicted amidohydrolase YtcJ
VGRQALTVAEAVKAYTLGSAYAEFQESSKGSIETGKLADFVILSDDIFTIAPARIDRAKVIMTVVNGRVVYDDVMPGGP